MTKIVQCRKCHQPLDVTQVAFGSEETGWEHPFKCPLVDPLDIHTAADLQFAIETAVSYHQDQRDKVGEPAILHPLAVMFAAREAGFGYTTQIVAVLHDTVEDTDLTLSQVQIRFGWVVRNAVDALSRRTGTDSDPDETYHDFILRGIEDPYFCRVKQLDLKHNLSRLKGLREAGEVEMAARCRRKWTGALRTIEDIEKRREAEKEGVKGA